MRSRWVFALCILASAGSAMAASDPRARDLGIPFPGQPGHFNAITDVAGVEVGETTLIRGDGALATGHGPVRTGVTVIHPLGKTGLNAVAAGFAVINGTGEFTGMRFVDETGLLLGPVALTGTGNIGAVHQAMVDWAARPGYLPPDEVFWHSLAVVGETLDIGLNDVFGHPVKQEDVFAALDGARSGPVPEGNVGGGTGMHAYGFKGGTGTASRVVHVGDKAYTVGVILQANNGHRRDLRIAGIPIGEMITDLQPEIGASNAPNPSGDKAKNSLLIVIATDAPLQAHQLQRMARRAALGVGRDGSTAANMSGEFALAFSTTNTSPLAGPPRSGPAISDLDSETMDPLLEATVQATEEAIVNQLVASRTMVGANGSKVYGLPLNRLVQILKDHRMLNSSVH